MTSSKLKALVEMIVRKTFSEMHDSHTLDGSNLVTIEGIQLPDGRKVGANIAIEGYWNDGAFNYEYGSQKGIHRYDPQFELESWSIEKVWDETSNTQLPLTPDLKAIIEAEMESISDEIEKEINENPPDPRD